MDLVLDILVPLLLDRARPMVLVLSLFLTLAPPIPPPHPTPHTERTMAGRGKQGAQSKYDHLIKLLLIGDSGT